MIRFELSPQPCQPRVIKSASHIRYPNFDCQSASAKPACKSISVASATAFNTTQFNVSRQPLDHFSSEKNQPRNGRHKKIQRQPSNIHTTTEARKCNQPQTATPSYNGRRWASTHTAPPAHHDLAEGTIRTAEYTTPSGTFLGCARHNLPSTKSGPPVGGPPSVPSRNRTENILIESQLI